MCPSVPSWRAYMKCGWNVLRTTPIRIAPAYGLPEPLLPVDHAHRYNIAPTQPELAVRQPAYGADRDAVLLKLGLIPPWAKDLKVGAKHINARSETAAEKPSFRHAFRKRRCLVPADGFFEWKPTGSKKQPFL